MECNVIHKPTTVLFSTVGAGTAFQLVGCSIMYMKVFTNHADRDYAYLNTVELNTGRLCSTGGVVPITPRTDVHVVVK